MWLIELSDLSDLTSQSNLLWSHFFVGKTHLALHCKSGGQAARCHSWGFCVLCTVKGKLKRTVSWDSVFYGKNCTAVSCTSRVSGCGHGVGQAPFCPSIPDSVSEETHTSLLYFFFSYRDFFVSKLWVTQELTLSLLMFMVLTWAEWWVRSRSATVVVNAWVIFFSCSIELIELQFGGLHLGIPCITWQVMIC